MMNEIWNRVLETMKSDINKQSFDMWLKDTTPLSMNNETLYVKVADDVARRHISSNYFPSIQNLIKDISSSKLSCEFVTEEDKKETDKKEKNITSDSIANDRNPIISLYPKYTFDNFIVGPNNQLSHAAAIAVSKAPATQYNPLFLYGGTGLGKTHLMQAIGHAVATEKPYLNIVYVPCEQFINDFIQSLRNNTMDSFKIRYRNVDILLIDDIQFIEKKEQTQEEFFHTFNTLYNNKKQLVISSDRPPKELSTLEERLRTRFEWGLITDIQPPNLETREAILRSKAEQEGMDIPDEVLNYLAKRIKSSIRALEAALKRLSIVTSLNNEPIDIQHAKIHLKHLFDEDMDKAVKLSDIMSLVSHKYDVTVDELISKSRHSKIVLPRFISIYLSRKLTNLTTTEIGREFGERDHSTVLNAIKNVEEMMREQEGINDIIEDMIVELKS